MSKPRFYKAKLVEVRNIIEYVYPLHHKEMTLEERMGKNAECPECNGNDWWLLPKESVAVSEGGKPYCECLHCGYQTHL